MRSASLRTLWRIAIQFDCVHLHGLGAIVVGLQIQQRGVEAISFGLAVAAWCIRRFGQKIKKRVLSSLQLKIIGGFEHF
jgi:hypothetical protein